MRQREFSADQVNERHMQFPPERERGVHGFNVLLFGISGSYDLGKIRASLFDGKHVFQHFLGGKRLRYMR